MSYVFEPAAQPAVPVHGSNQLFAVHRIYCVGRNYEDHAKEMGHTGREAPFFFMKPADAVLTAAPDGIAHMPYPTLTSNLHHEVELVVAIGKGGSRIKATDAMQHIYGYAVGLDMTRRDLQNDMKKQGRPWGIGKGFEHSAPIGAITPASQINGIEQAEIALTVNGQTRQKSTIAKLIWNIAETIEQLSAGWTLQPGDLIYTGTPEGVAAVVASDLLQASVTGLQPLAVRITPPVSN
jgi:fumarylpyruvate hydrolase